MGVVVEAEHAGFGAGYFLAGFVHVVHHVETILVGIGSSNVDVEHVAVKRFALVFYRHIDHDEAEFGDSIVVVGQANGAQEMHPRLVQNAQQSIVAQVAAVVKVGDAHRYFSGKGKGIRQGYFYAGHECS